MRKAKIDRRAALEAIARVARKLGRAPTWGELRRMGGVPESRVRVYFGSLAEAVRAAGLEPGRAGLKIATEDLLEDFARVAAKLGRWPSRNEYVREGKYSAGAFYARYGSWPAVQEAVNGRGRAESTGKLPELPRLPKLTIGTSTQQSAVSVQSTQRDVFTTEGTEEHGEEGKLPQMNADERRKTSTQQSAVSIQSTQRDVFTTEGTEEHGEEKQSPQMNADDRGSETEHGDSRELNESDKAIAMQWAGAMAALPGELAGKRRVTDAVCAMIVRTLLGAESDWQGQLSRYLGPGKENHTADERGLTRIESGQVSANGDAMLARANGYGAAGLQRQNGPGVAALARVNGSITSGGILDGERPVMGAPFYPCALSNAPANEMGVVLLFGMLAGELGFQIEAVQGKYPDIEAKRQIQPGKWQRVRIEIEYESRNFALHGHDAAKCDVIVCWKHNWAKCPKHIEVIELSKVV